MKAMIICINLVYCTTEFKNHNFVNTQTYIQYYLHNMADSSYIISFNAVIGVPAYIFGIYSIYIFPYIVKRKIKLY